MIDVKTLTIRKAREHLLKGDFSARELAEAYLAVINEKNKTINAYVEVYDDVLQQADRADEVLKEKGEESPVLTGIPIALKDNMLVKGRGVTCGSKILEGYTATYDGGVIDQLRQAGAVLLGRTNMDEFAMGSSTETSAFGITRNPHDTTRVPGGSSGGAAAAVAMGGALASFGSDTGGSIRQPASYCGVVGLKPTYGTVSRSGLVALASSLDQIGPFAKDCEDARLLFHAVAGHDRNDSTSYQMAMRTYDRPLRKVIGVPYHLFEDLEGIDSDVLENFKETLAIYEQAGYEVRSIELPSVKYALAAYYVILPAEASSNLARFDGVRYGLYREGSNLIDDYHVTRGEGFGKEVRRRILLGTYVLSAGYYDAYYNKALLVQKKIREDLERAFEDVDVIMTPTAPSPAFRIGEKLHDPIAMYLSDIFTVSANIAGVPALSVPSGTVERDGVAVPVGLHSMAPHFGEDLLCDMGRVLEGAR